MSVTRCGTDLMHAIYDRRSVRRFTETPVSAGAVRMLLDAAVQAPSALDRQPWAFVVLQDPALLKSLSKRAKAIALARLAPDAPERQRARLEDPESDIFHGAGTLIVLCAAPMRDHPEEDCCLAAQNLMLAAHGHGLGTCIIGDARDALASAEIKRELGIPADHEVVVPIAVGHPRELPEPPPRSEPRILAWR